MAYIQNEIKYTNIFVSIIKAQLSVITGEFRAARERD